jgi:hypothetical protein
MKRCVSAAATIAVLSVGAIVALRPSRCPRPKPTSAGMPCSKGQPERRALIKADVRRHPWIHEFTPYDARVELDQPCMMRCIIGRPA